MSFRIEKKIYIDKKNLFEFKNFLLNKKTKKIFKERIINSVYFDNIKMQIYQDSTEGILPRKKIRIRTYPNTENSFFYFEKKISSVEGRYKSKKKISHKECLKFLNEGTKDNQYGFCFPLLNVRYIRQYYQLNDVRITIDNDIAYNLYKKDLIKKDLRSIVELKCSISKNLDDLQKDFPFQEIRFSKFSNGVEFFFN